MRDSRPLRAIIRTTARSGAGLLALLLANACHTTPPEARSVGSAQAQLSPPPRAIHAEGDTVIIEGRWQAIDGAEGLPLMNMVRAVCNRARDTCREELSSVGAEGVQEAVQHQSFEYQVKEWTKWKILAVRRSKRGTHELRISIIGLAAERVEKAVGAETENRWRLE